MLRQNQNGESVQWIALLADEFAGISETELEKALITGQTIDKQAACAVIARLGYTPQSRTLYRAGFGPLAIEVETGSRRDTDSLLASHRSAAE